MVLKRQIRHAKLVQNIPDKALSYQLASYKWNNMEFHTDSTNTLQLETVSLGLFTVGFSLSQHVIQWVKNAHKNKSLNKSHGS